MKGRGNQTQLLFSEHLGEISYCYNIGYADHIWPFHPILGIAGHNQWGFNGHNHPLLWLAHWPRAPAMKCHVDLGQTCLGASRDIGFLFHRTSFDRKRESGGCSTERRTFEHTAQFSSLQKTRPSSQYQNSYLDLAVDRETAMLSTLADKFKLKSVCNLVVCSAVQNMFCY